MMEMSFQKEWANKHWHQDQLKLGQTNAFIKLDKHFQAVFLFTNLKLF